MCLYFIMYAVWFPYAIASVSKSEAIPYKLLYFLIHRTQQKYNIHKQDKCVKFDSQML